jgi:cobalamin biosynthesis protein CbiG
MMVAGIGCRRGVSAEAVLSAIAAALQSARRGAGPTLLATIPRRAEESGLREAAHTLGLTLIVPEEAALLAAAPHCLTRSEHALALTGLPSVAECAALAAVAPHARLLGARVILGGVTCALAEQEMAIRETPA